VARALDPERYELEMIHLGDRKDKIAEAKAQGVQSVPALILDNQPFHINFGAALSALE
jgi:glutaredoxin